MAAYLSVDGGTTFTAGPEVNTYSTSTIAVSGNGTLAAVISSYTGELWLWNPAVPVYTPDPCLDHAPFTTPNLTPQYE